MYKNSEISILKTMPKAPPDVFVENLQIDWSTIKEITKLPEYWRVLYLATLAYNVALRSLIGDYIERNPDVFQHWKNIAEILSREAQIGTGTVQRESMESVATSMRTYILQVLEQIKQSNELPGEWYLLERIFESDLNRISDTILWK